jgi:hypothetical protein
MIRSPEDPERTERPKGGRAIRVAHRTLELTTVDHWKREIVRLLSDGVPRTFNRMGVELIDQTADMLLDSPVDRAVWELVEASFLEHTMEVPIYFRIQRRARSGARPLGCSLSHSPLHRRHSHREPPGQTERTNTAGAARSLIAPHVGHGAFLGSTGWTRSNGSIRSRPSQLMTMLSSQPFSRDRARAARRSRSSA